MIQLRSHIKKPNCPKCASTLNLGAAEDNHFHFLWTCSNRHCRAIYDLRSGIETDKDFPTHDPKFALNWDIPDNPVLTALAIKVDEQIRERRALLTLKKPLTPEHPQ